MKEYDVIVVGAGKAAFCAALAAQEQGASVLVLEAAPEDEAGGNSRFTAGSIRVVYNGVDDIKALVPDLTEAEIATTDFGTYTADQFFDDMARVTQHRADPDLVELLVTKSFPTLCWMRDKGTRVNAGDGIRLALGIGAAPCGNWSGCHAVQWEMNAPEFGDLAVGDQFQKHSYPFSILINATGKRFVDEGADFRNYTYAKYGRVVLEQPGQFAWQIFDQKVKHLQRDEYKIRQITKVAANTIEEFAQKLEGVNAEQFLKSIAEYNKAVRRDIPFNPNIKDGRRTEGLAINKSNWANTIDQPPFEGYAVTCGLTFTFGGVRITTEGEVLNTDYHPIRGLYAAGELVGGLFYFNYPGGSGLTSGAVFGRIAGASAARAGKN